MDEFTFYSERLGWVESSIQETIEDEWNKERGREMEKKPRMAISIYDGIPHPTYPYTKAISAFSATVQLYARSGQLPVKAIVAERSGDSDGNCTYGCPRTESIHHLMVECPAFEEWRRKTEERSIELAQETEKRARGVKELSTQHQPGWVGQVGTS